MDVFYYDKCRIEMCVLVCVCMRVFLVYGRFHLFFNTVTYIDENLQMADFV